MEGSLSLEGEEDTEKTSGRGELTESTASPRVIGEPPGQPTSGKAAPVTVPPRLIPP